MFTAQPANADDEIFEITELQHAGRVVAAQFADFDGDGRRDLMLVTLEGIPPTQRRRIHVHRQTLGGTIPVESSFSTPLPQWSAVYDVADVQDTPGDELLLLRPDRVTVLSLAGEDGKQWDWLVDGSTTLGAADDELGFERFRLAYDEFGDAPWILVPQIGAISALSADGEPLARLAVGRRANYFVSSGTGLLSVESDMQLYFDAPKISVGDIDGDGQSDILTATRHELRVFLRDSAGGFPNEASYAVALELIEETDFSRGTGSVVTSARDIDADGRLDLMISHRQGSMADTATTTRIYFNRDGGWDLTAPDDEFVVEGAVSSSLLMNIDRSDALELVRIQVKFNILEIVEMLLTREIDTRLFIHRLRPDGRFGAEPWSSKTIGTGISFDTFRPKGFMPRAGLDLNGDGLMDFISSANGKGIEVYLGGDEGPFARRTAMQRLPTTGIIEVGDLDGDGLADFVLYDPQNPNAVVRVGINSGVLPGSSRSAGPGP